MDNLERWEDLVHAAQVKVLMEHSVNPHNAQMIPPTGPPALDTVSEISNTLARLVPLLMYQKARLEQMELGRDYTMVKAWTKQTEAMIESLGVGSVSIARTLQRHGYTTTPRSPGSSMG